MTNFHGQILRRALRYRRSRYSLIVPTALDAGPELNSKWRQWVEQESFKRYELE